MKSPSESNHALWLVAGCFFLSGFAALVYETVWLRQFAILLGTSQAALAIVLSSYMGGLALGSLAAGKWAYRTKHPVILYAILELGIAAAALCIPVGLRLARAAQSYLFGGNPDLPTAGHWGPALFNIATCWTLILIPTALMGATLPLLARMVVSKDEQLGPRIGLLYGINTLGAVVGTTVAAFVCLPVLGLGKTTWVAALANTIVFFVVAVLARWGAFSPRPAEATAQIDLEPIKPKPAKRGRRPSVPATDSLTDPTVAPNDRLRWVAMFIGISGVLSFAYEIVFTRMLGHFIGGSVFAFSIMLAGFLLGIAIGGLVASRLAQTRERAATLFIYCQALTALGAVVAYRCIDWLAGVDAEFWMNWAIMHQQAVASVVSLLPISTFIGASFPLAIRVFSRDESESASGSAWTYSCNTVGGILGALLTGAVALPLWGYQGVTSLAAAGNLALAGMAVVVFRLRKIHLVAVAIAAVMLVNFRPDWPEHVLRVSALSGKQTGGAIIYNHVGQSSTITVFYDAGPLRFQTNGLPESYVPPAGSGTGYLLDSICLSGIAPLMRPGCEDMLMIGLGGGAAASTIPPSVKRIDVLELEPAVIEANRAISVYREHDPLTDPRLRIVINDARNALLLTTRKYDAIISQPSHPWTAGASHLYTRQFAQIVRQRLNPGGVYVQWMNSSFVDEELLQSLGATLLSVFPQVRLYQPTKGEFLFVGSDESMRPESVVPASRSEAAVLKIDPLDRSYYRRIGIISPTHLFSWLMLDHRGVEMMSQGAALITDERNLLAMKASKLRRGHDPELSLRFARSYSPLARSLIDAKQLCPSLDLCSLSLCLVRKQRNEYVQELVLPKIKDESLRSLLESELAASTEGKEPSLQCLLRGMKVDVPDSRLCFKLLIERFVDQGNNKRISEETCARCRQNLRPEHEKIYALLLQLADGDLDWVRDADAQLAMIPVDDVTFSSTVIARLLWRITSKDPDPNTRKRLAKEAIEIADEAAPFGLPLSLSWYRTVAAVKADQPYLALATTDVLAENITAELMEDGSATAPSASLKVLRQCREAITQPSVAAGVYRARYEEVLAKVDYALKKGQRRSR